MSSRSRRSLPPAASLLATLLVLAIAAGPALAWLPGPSTESLGSPSHPRVHSMASPLMAEKSLSVDGAWLPIPPPGGRREHVSVYDPERGRMIVFGGYGEKPFQLSDVWVLALEGSPTWQRLPTAGTPPPNAAGQAAIYDPVRDRLVVNVSTGAWELTLSGVPTWSQLNPAGTPPGGRSEQSAIYDPIGDQMVIFGGLFDDGVDFFLYNDVWALSLAGTPAWTQILPTGGPPAPRAEHVAVYDPARQAMIVHGGLDVDSGELGDVWTLSLGGAPAWAELTPTGGPPAARGDHAAIYDPIGDRVVFFGGRAPGKTDEVWGLSLAGTPAWNDHTPAGAAPSARAEHTAIYDPAGERMVVFGGTDYESIFSATHLSDAWALSLAGTPAWGQLVAPSPGGLALHSAIYRPASDQMLIFGGRSPGSGSTIHNWVWAYSPSATPSWSLLAPAGAPPSPRAGHSAIYDPVRDRMIVFGGQYGGGNDVWELTFSGTPTWNQLAPLGTPPGVRYQHSAIYDPAGDRMLVFGGWFDPSYYNDLWQLNLAGTPTWTLLAPGGTVPAARSSHSAIYDPAGPRMLVFGGRSSTTTLGDLHTLSLSGMPTWSTLATSGTSPPATREHSAVYDALRGRMVLVAGTGSVSNRPWALDLAGAPTWSELFPTGSLPIGRAGAAAIYDPVRDRMVVHSGWRETAFEYKYFFNDAWTINWSDLVGVPPPDRLTGLQLHASPIPAMSQLAIRFSLPVAGRASLVVYDLAGRQVKVLRDGDQPAGPHVVHWDLRREDGPRVAAGVYFCELRAGEGRAARRLAVLD